MLIYFLCLSSRNRHRLFKSSGEWELFDQKFDTDLKLSLLLTVILVLKLRLVVCDRGLYNVSIRLGCVICSFATS